MMLFDFLHRGPPELGPSVVLFATTGALAGSLCSRFFQGRLWDGRLIARGLLMGLGLGIVAWYVAGHGHRNYRAWQAYNEQMRLHDDEVLEKRRRMAELLRIANNSS
jgi:hypothetical protein